MSECSGIKIFTQQQSTKSQSVGSEQRLEESVALLKLTGAMYKTIMLVTVRTVFMSQHMYAAKDFKLTLQEDIEEDT